MCLLVIMRNGGRFQKYVAMNTPFILCCKEGDLYNLVVSDRGRYRLFRNVVDLEVASDA